MVDRRKLLLASQTWMPALLPRRSACLTWKCGREDSLARLLGRSRSARSGWAAALTALPAHGCGRITLSSWCPVARLPAAVSSQLGRPAGTSRGRSGPRSTASSSRSFGAGPAFLLNAASFPRLSSSRWRPAGAAEPGSSRCCRAERGNFGAMRRGCASSVTRPRAEARPTQRPWASCVVFSARRAVGALLPVVARHEMHSGASWLRRPARKPRARRAVIGAVVMPRLRTRLTPRTRSSTRRTRVRRSLPEPSEATMLPVFAFACVVLVVCGLY